AQGRKSSASTRSRWKKAAMASCSFTISASRRALITIQPGNCARSAASRSRWADSSPARSILLKTRRRGTPFAPISSSTSSVTVSWRSNPGALRLAPEVHRVELLLQLGDAVADLAPVELAVRLAAAAAAGAAARPVLRPCLLGGFAQARCHVAKTRDLDLRARGAGARVPVKDFEDHHRAIHHLAADLLLQVERLRGGDLVVDENRVGGVCFAQQAQ